MLVGCLLKIWCATGDVGGGLAVSLNNNVIRSAGNGLRIISNIYCPMLKLTWHELAA